MTEKPKPEPVNPVNVLTSCLVLVILTLAGFGLAVSIVWRIANW